MMHPSIQPVDKNRARLNSPASLLATAVYKLGGKNVVSTKPGSTYCAFHQRTSLQLPSNEACMQCPVLLHVIIEPVTL